MRDKLHDYYFELERAAWRGDYVPRDLSAKPHADTSDAPFLPRDAAPPVQPERK